MQDSLKTSSSAELASLHAALRACESELASVTEKLHTSERERKAAVKKAKECSDKFESLSSDVAFTQEVNKSLESDKAGWVKQIADAAHKHAVELAAKDAMIADLEEQVRDLMFTMESQARVEALSEAEKAELRGGTLAIGEAAASPAPATKAKRKGKK